jgi:hypothetical protein
MLCYLVNLPWWERQFIGRVVQVVKWDAADGTWWIEADWCRVAYPSASYFTAPPDRLRPINDPDADLSKDVPIETEVDEAWDRLLDFTI